MKNKKYSIKKREIPMKLKKWLKEYWKILLGATAFFSITLYYIFCGSLVLGVAGILCILVGNVHFLFTNSNPTQILSIYMALYSCLLLLSWNNFIWCVVNPIALAMGSVKSAVIDMIQDKRKKRKAMKKWNWKNG